MSVSKVITIGRWSDPRLVYTSHEAYGRIDMEAKDISGEDGGPLVGSLVGFSVFKVPRLDDPISSQNCLPRVSDSPECHRES